MRALRNVLVAAAAAATVFAAGPAHAATVPVQGESATSYSTGCGDGGDAMDMGPAVYGGVSTMFFPASGCWARYTGDPKVLVGAQVILSGIGGSICGTLTAVGSVTSGVATFCLTNDTPSLVTFDRPVVSTGPVTVTWRTTSPTPSYANLFLDYLVGIG